MGGWQSIDLLRHGGFNTIVFHEVCFCLCLRALYAFAMYKVYFLADLDENLYAVIFDFYFL